MVTLSMIPPLSLFPLTPAKPTVIPALVTPSPTRKWLIGMLIWWSDSDFGPSTSIHNYMDYTDDS